VRDARCRLIGLARRSRRLAGRWRDASRQN
jgi:hypothetical protein